MMPVFLDHLLRAFVVVVLCICLDDNATLARAAARDGAARPGVRRALARRILWVGLALIAEVLRFVLQR